MLLPLYEIYAIDENGETVRLFTWRGNPENGIARAKQDAKKFGKSHYHSYSYQLVEREL